MAHSFQFLYRNGNRMPRELHFQPIQQIAEFFDHESLQRPKRQIANISPAVSKF